MIELLLNYLINDWYLFSCLFAGLFILFLFDCL